MLVATLAQVKGNAAYHGGQRQTITADNVSVEKGYVCTASNRREWLFVQFAGDVSPADVKLYEDLNNLGALARDARVLVLAVLLVHAFTLALTTSVCLLAGLDFPDAHLRQCSHADVVDELLDKVRAGEFAGEKPGKGVWSTMYPSMHEGHMLAKYLLQQPQVLAHLAVGDAGPTKGEDVLLRHSFTLF